MANYRQIHTCIWKDAWFFELDPDAKLLWIYLFSNERANLTGLYDLHKRIIAFETGLDAAAVERGFKQFEDAGKAYYEGGWVWVPNLIKYNAANLKSTKIVTHIQNAFDQIPDIPLKARCVDRYNGMVDPEYRIDTLSLGYPQEQEQEHIQEQDIHGDADASPPESEDPEPQRKRSEHDETRLVLEQHFADKTGLPRPKANTAKQKRSAGSLWWGPLREIAELCEWDADLAVRLIDATVDHLRGNVTIASPKSILKTAKAAYTGNAPGIPPLSRASPTKRTITIKDPLTGDLVQVEATA